MRAQNASAAELLKPTSRSVPRIRSSEGPRASWRRAFARALTSDISQPEVGKVLEVDYYYPVVDNHGLRNRSNPHENARAVRPRGNRCRMLQRKCLLRVRLLGRRAGANSSGVGSRAREWESGAGCGPAPRRNGRGSRNGGRDRCVPRRERRRSSGRAIGVDMTPAMVDRARDAARSPRAPNTSFVLAPIERIPLADNIADVVLSNCVINLSSDKPAVFAEAFRILKPGGRLAISDIVQERDLGKIEDDCGCVATAMVRAEYLNTIRDAGFRELHIAEDRAWRTGPNRVEASAATPPALEHDRGETRVGRRR